MPTDKEVGIRRIPAYTLHYTTGHHRKRATNKLTTKKGDGIVFFTLGMWMFLTTMERSMRELGIYPQQQRLW